MEFGIVTAWDEKVTGCTFFTFPIQRVPNGTESTLEIFGVEFLGAYRAYPM